jgi:hypothetical protein
VTDNRNPNLVRYTCSDGMRIDITPSKADLSARKDFIEYLNTREDDPTDYLVNGTLHGWQDFYVEARNRTYRSLRQIEQDVHGTRHKWQDDVDDVLFFEENQQ